MPRQLPIFRYSVQNRSDNSVDIHIDGDIIDSPSQQIYREWFGDTTSVSFKSFREEIQAADASVYNIYINSGGGSLIEAMAMHDLLVEMQANGKTVNTIGRGIIASAATYILMAGKSPEMSANSWLMIHNVSGGVWGNVTEVERYANTLRTFNNQCRDFYANHTGISKKAIEDMMEEETWLPANEAKEKGFVKKVTGVENFTNKISRDQWQFGNLAVLNAYNSSVQQIEGHGLSSFIQNQFNDMKNFFNTAIQALKGVQPAEGATNQDIINQLVTALEGSLQAANTEVENHVTEVVNALRPSIVEEVTNSVRTELTAQFKGQLDALEAENTQLKADKTGLEKEKETLEKEVANALGAESTPENKGAVQPIGEWTTV